MALFTWAALATLGAPRFLGVVVQAFIERGCGADENIRLFAELSFRPLSTFLRPIRCKLVRCSGKGAHVVAESSPRGGVTLKKYAAVCLALGCSESDLAIVWYEHLSPEEVNRIKGFG